MHADALGDLVRGDDELEPCIACDRDVAPLGRAEDEDLLGRELVPQLDSLRDGHDAECGRAGPSAAAATSTAPWP